MLSLLRPRSSCPYMVSIGIWFCTPNWLIHWASREENILVAEDGDIIEVTEDAIGLIDHVSSGNVFVDGLSVGDVGQIVLRDRKVLSQDGILMVVMTMDKDTGQPLAGPDIVSRGFVYMRDAEALLESAAYVFWRVWQPFSIRIMEVPTGRLSKIRSSNVSEYLYEQTHRRPMILPIVMDVCNHIRG